ncbi:MAG: helix-turn-helix domain-containing protein [Shewanella psychromarinicola]|jgi:predicted site-specific integrase-resolvase|uniref:DNA-binding protein n=1 Tax=Shewanella psychromarinicola TaxID=2487742 RepID=A0A3N4DTL3_9GAMM|nr:MULTISPECIES: helix-turn-helix domain-containing protein [Shewanella]AZG33637.1 DNA-binding protein [Shewanella psychromarinicola]MCL1082130.1 helix-turn-helix domain-containing protein [Shewanella psychromarinicola]PKG78695.1 DNA-binding protein [Shewanella sp. Actino-trap-3]RPA27942.1 DNA-binding protein [Shewanella psychromarinicola]|tara:strand:+ start:58759 stop:58932 length:174 start_codon:yes stop_codon:yes gene_type:complete
MSDANDLTLNEVCEILDKSPTTIKRYARENLLFTEQHGNVLSFNKAEVMRYLAFSER